MIILRRTIWTSLNIDVTVKILNKIKYVNKNILRQIKMEVSFN